jgi:hypothetical protein
MRLALVALQRLGHVPNAETRKWGLTGRLSNQYAFILRSVMYLGMCISRLKRCRNVLWKMALPLGTKEII